MERRRIPSLHHGRSNISSLVTLVHAIMMVVAVVFMANRPITVEAYTGVLGSTLALGDAVLGSSTTPLLSVPVGFSPTFTVTAQANLDILVVYLALSGAADCSSISFSGAANSSYGSISRTPSKILACSGTSGSVTLPNSSTVTTIPLKVCLAAVVVGSSTTSIDPTALTYVDTGTLYEVVSSNSSLVVTRQLDPVSLSTTPPRLSIQHTRADGSVFSFQNLIPAGVQLVASWNIANPPSSSNSLGETAATLTTSGDSKDFDFTASSSPISTSSINGGDGGIFGYEYYLSYSLVVSSSTTSAFDSFIPFVAGTTNSSSSDNDDVVVIRRQDCTSTDEYGVLYSALCLTCPLGAICNGSSVFLLGVVDEADPEVLRSPFPKTTTSMWRANNSTNSIYSCVPPYGNSQCEPRSLTGTCKSSAGYEGPRCSNCREGFGRSFEGCSECGSVGGSITTVIIVGVVTLSVIVLFVLSSVSSSPTDYLPVYLKMLITHVAFVSALPQFHHSLPTVVEFIFTVFRTASRPSTNGFTSVDCAWQLSYYYKWATLQAIPLVAFFAVGAVALLIGCARKISDTRYEQYRQEQKSDQRNEDLEHQEAENEEHKKAVAERTPLGRQLFNTLLICLFLLYPSYVEEASRVMRCDEIESGSRLPSSGTFISDKINYFFYDRTLLCSDSFHQYFGFTALAWGIIWCVALPLILLGIFAKLRSPAAAESVRTPKGETESEAKLEEGIAQIGGVATSSQVMDDEREEETTHEQRKLDDVVVTAPLPPKGATEIEVETEKRYFFFLGGYHPRTWYWEGFSYLRKLLFFVSLTFIDDNSLKASVLTWILLIYLCATATVAPFIDTHLDMLENVSMAAAAATFNLSLLYQYLPETVDAATSTTQDQILSYCRLVLTVTLLGLNGVFLLVLLSFVIRGTLIKYQLYIINNQLRLRKEWSSSSYRSAMGFAQKDFRFAGGRRKIVARRQQEKLNEVLLLGAVNDIESLYDEEEERLEKSVKDSNEESKQNKGPREAFQTPKSATRQQESGEHEVENNGSRGTPLQATSRPGGNPPSSVTRVPYEGQMVSLEQYERLVYLKLRDQIFAEFGEKSDTAKLAKTSKELEEVRKNYIAALVQLSALKNQSAPPPPLTALTPPASREAVVHVSKTLPKEAGSTAGPTPRSLGTPGPAPRGAVTRARYGIVVVPQSSSNGEAAGPVSRPCSAAESSVSSTAPLLLTTSGRETTEENSIDVAPPHTVVGEPNMEDRALILKASAKLLEILQDETWIEEVLRAKMVALGIAEQNQALFDLVDHQQIIQLNSWWKHHYLQAQEEERQTGYPLSSGKKILDMVQTAVNKFPSDPEVMDAVLQVAEKEEALLNRLTEGILTSEVSKPQMTRTHRGEKPG